MKHSQARLDAPFCHVYHFRGDRIVSFQQYTDTAQWAQRMA
jgi:ketosteroid isomerase-like protein